MKNNDTQELPKMTLEEYEQKYSRRENARLARSVLRILEAAVGLVIAATLLFVVLRLFEVHRIAGFISIGLAVVFFVFCYVIPVRNIKELKAFDVNVNHHNAKAARKHNKKLRREIADKIIEFSARCAAGGLARHQGTPAPAGHLLWRPIHGPSFRW